MATIIIHVHVIAVFNKIDKNVHIYFTLVILIFDKSEGWMVMKI